MSPFLHRKYKGSRKRGQNKPRLYRRDRFLLQLEAALEQVADERSHVGEGGAVGEARQVARIPRGQRPRPLSVGFEGLHVHAIGCSPVVHLLSQLREDAQAAVIYISPDEERRVFGQTAEETTSYARANREFLEKVMASL